MSVKFFYHPHSPPCGVVWMVLKELGIDYTEQIIDFYTEENKHEQFLKVNPRMLVPVIKDGDMILTESRAISIYLCLKFEGEDKKNKLYPRDLKEQARFLEIMMRDVDNYHAVFNYLNAWDVFAGKSQFIRDDLLPRCENVLQEYDDMLATSDYVFGTHLTVLDYAWAQTVSLLAIGGYNDWDKYPNLKKWQELLSKLPYFDECSKIPGEGHKLMFQLLLKKSPSEAYAIYLEQQKLK